MADANPFQSLNLAQVQTELMKLYERVACEKGRVEIVSGSGACECVLISKAELESLENALEILADADGVKHLSAELAQIAHAAEPIGA
jgi:PHD/YefM family antitoxin component YafN of YafNO toxin-antitoxin module